MRMILGRAGQVRSVAYFGLCGEDCNRNRSFTDRSAVWQPGDDISTVQPLVFNHLVAKKLSKALCCGQST